MKKVLAFAIGFIILTSLPLVKLQAQSPNLATQPASGATPLRQEELWNRLTATDLVEAQRAVWELVVGNDATISFLKGKLPINGPDDEAIRSLIRQLDSDSHKERQAASDALRQLGFAAESALKNAAGGAPSPEMASRLRDLREILKDPLSANGTIQLRRGVQVLEMIDSADARQFLRAFGKNSPCYSFAQESLGRISSHAQPQGRLQFVVWDAIVTDRQLAFRLLASGRSQVDISSKEMIAFRADNRDLHRAFAGVDFSDPMQFVPGSPGALQVRQVTSGSQGLAFTSSPIAQIRKGKVMMAIIGSSNCMCSFSPEGQGLAVTSLVVGANCRVSGGTKTSKNDLLKLNKPLSISPNQALCFFLPIQDGAGIDGGYLVCLEAAIVPPSTSAAPPSVEKWASLGQEGLASNSSRNGETQPVRKPTSARQ